MEGDERRELLSRLSGSRHHLPTHSTRRVGLFNCVFQSKKPRVREPKKQCQDMVKATSIVSSRAVMPEVYVSRVHALPYISLWLSREI